MTTLGKTAYCPEGLAGEQMIENLRLKLQDKEFCIDINSMVKSSSPDYDAQIAGELVIEKLLTPLCKNPKEGISLS